MTKIFLTVQNISLCVLGLNIRNVICVESRKSCLELCKERYQIFRGRLAEAGSNTEIGKLRVLSVISGSWGNVYHGDKIRRKLFIFLLVSITDYSMARNVVGMFYNVTKCWYNPG